MAIERQPERRRRRTQSPAPPDAPRLEAPGDTARVARAAAESAAGVQATPAGIEVTIRTTTSRNSEVVRVVATPETPIAELMDEACSRLEVEDQSRYVLVASGEVLGDGSRPVSDLVDEQLGSSLEVRLVRKPEAGAPARASHAYECARQKAAHPQQARFAEFAAGPGEDAHADCPQ